MSFTTLTAGAVCFLIAVLWLLSPKYDATEPRPLSHTIPILGQALFWMRDRHAFFAWGDRASHQNPYSVLIAGRKHYVFSKPSDVSTVFRKTKVLSIDGFVRMLFIKLFGMKKDDLDHYMALNAKQHELNAKYLLRPEHYNLTVVAFLKELKALVQKLESDVDSSEAKALPKDGFVLVMDLMANASVVAYFGRQPVEMNPKFTDDMRVFVTKGFWPLLSSFPAFLTKEARGARERLKANIMTATIDSPRDDVSEYVRQKVKLYKPTVSKDGIARDEFALLFGFTSNSSPMSYIAMLRILTVPGLMADVRAEVDAARVASLEVEELQALVPDGLPRLRAVYYEVLRVHTVAASIREVLETTELTSKSSSDGTPRSYKLEKGGVVNMPSSILHFDKEVHPDPEKFNPKRFLSTELGGMGTNVSTSTRAFGGGTSYCPGRVFAERQIVAFLALLFAHFDVMVTDKTCVVPKSAEFPDTVGAPRAHLKLSRRAS